jgi:uncharacterized protein (DUF1499 family)
MLTGVLLHVIVTAVPVDLTLDKIRLKRRCDQMSNAFVFIDDVENTLATQQAQVVGLAARGRIESGSIKVGSASVLGSVYNLRIKAREIRITVI